MTICISLLWTNLSLARKKNPDTAKILQGFPQGLVHLWTAIPVLLLSLSHSTLPGLRNTAEGTWALCQLVFATAGCLCLAQAGVRNLLGWLCLPFVFWIWSPCTKPWENFLAHIFPWGGGCLPDLLLFLLLVLNPSYVPLSLLLKAGPWRICKNELMNGHW